MGLFDDFTKIITEANSLRDEVTRAGNELVKDLMADASDIQKSAAETTASVNGSPLPDDRSTQATKSTLPIAGQEPPATD